MTINRWQVRQLSHAQCEFLTEHIDIVRPICLEAGEDKTRAVMLQRGYIRYEPYNAIKPRGTVLTDDGREMVCAICDMWLEALTRVQQLRVEKTTHDSLLRELLKRHGERHDA
jgi:hypothetical protein